MILYLRETCTARPLQEPKFDRRPMKPGLGGIEVQLLCVGCIEVARDRRCDVVAGDTYKRTENVTDDTVRMYTIQEK
jgi:hypothetical protein